MSSENVTLDEILEDCRKYETSREKGTSFELLCVKILRAWKDRFNFERVDLWSEWGFGEKDCGIDIVARDKYGEYTAIQCKFYSKNKKIYQDDIASFFMAITRTYTLDNEKISFSQSILMDTAKDLADKKTFEERIINFKRIDYTELKEANIDWSQFKKHNEIVFNPKKKLKDHQIKAINACLEELKTTSRTKLIMACGTGKTLCSIRLLDKELKEGNIAVFFAPSIALVAQVLKESLEQSEKNFSPFCVCSDTKVGKNDDEDMKTYELPILTTTDSQKLAEHIKKDLEANARVIIFSTYQSIDAVILAQKLLNENFSIIIADEAHRTAGFALKDKAQSYFLKVHSDENIKADKRLYMSATPKIFTEGSKIKAKNDETLLYSMDDNKIFGNVAYELDFGSAQAQGLLVEYKVLISIIDKQSVVNITNDLAKKNNEKKKTQSLIIATKDENEYEIDIELVAKIIATYKNLIKQDVFIVNGENKEYLDNEEKQDTMKRVIAFNSSIRNSKIRTNIFNPIIELYDKKTNSKKQNIDLKHIDGTMNQSQKNLKLSWLKEKNNEIRILSNAKCLTEGVDVPALDAVIFFDSKDSIIDIVQAVGRVMRKAENKKYGYIILPIMLDKNEELKYDEILSSDKFKIVWKVLKALRSHDKSLVSEAEYIKKLATSTTTISINDETSTATKGGDTSGIETSALAGLQNTTYESDVNFVELTKRIYSIIPNKLGDREYWSSFVKNVATIVPILESRIKALLVNDENIKEEFENFLKALKSNINSNIKEQDAITMLVQHIITRPIFEAIFPKGEFRDKNAISQSMDKVYAKLQEYGLEDETSKLASLYKSVSENTNYAKSDREKQEIIKNLYNNFFNSAFQKESEKLGIVYTPIEVVDFIIHSANFVLKKHFKKELKDKGVNILDGFTGTGTFIVRLLQSGLLNENLEHKYNYELHANEITLLAYYIANLNITAAYHSIKEDSKYLMPPGLLLTDTFELEEHKENLYESEFFGENIKNIQKQKETKIDVIIGNPPYSSGQKSANDDNKNTQYKRLNARIADTYIKHGTQTLKKNLYDSYILAIRWASDRIKENGIVSFVTNGSFISSNNMQGLRACLEQEFSAIYVLDLRGNQRTEGEESEKEGGKIFGGDSRASVAIMLLIKDEKYKGEKAELYYYDIGNYLSREQKLGLLDYFKDISNVDFKRIKPDKYNDWINQRDESFYDFVELANKNTKFKDGLDIFECFAQGVLTSRDSWCFNFSKDELTKNMQNTIEFYNNECENFAKDKNYIFNKDESQISWSENLLNSARNNKIYTFNENSIRTCLYRPYNKIWLYYSATFNERRYQLDSIYPMSKKAYENKAIVITGLGTNKDFSALMSNIITEYHTQSNGQIFPLYYYEKSSEEALKELELKENSNEYQRKDAIRTWALNEFRQKYKDEKISKEDIFYYIYGLFHCKEYKEKFKNNFSKMLPRIPYCKDFWGFSKIGRTLAELHLNYETIELKESKAIYDLHDKSLFSDISSLKDEDFKVSKMRFERGEKISQKPSRIIYNDKISIINIPEKAYDYRVNGKSAIAWIMQRYQVTTDPQSTITKDPNLFSDNPRYILDLLLKVIEVSVRSVDWIEKLPQMEILT